MNRRTGEASKRSPFLSYAIHPQVLCLHLFVPNPKPVLSKAEGSAFEIPKFLLLPTAYCLFQPNPPEADQP
jgi:hypothetical protein